MTLFFIVFLLSFFVLCFFLLKFFKDFEWKFFVSQISIVLAWSDFIIFIYQMIFYGQCLFVAVVFFLCWLCSHISLGYLVSFFWKIACCMILFCLIISHFLCNFLFHSFSCDLFGLGNVCHLFHFFAFFCCFFWNLTEWFLHLRNLHHCVFVIWKIVDSKSKMTRWRGNFIEGIFVCYQKNRENREFCVKNSKKYLTFHFGEKKEGRRWKK